MYAQMLKRIWCWLDGHKWNSVHGWYDQPNPNALCYRCGKVHQN